MSTARPRSCSTCWRRRLRSPSPPTPGSGSRSTAGAGPSAGGGRCGSRPAGGRRSSPRAGRQLARSRPLQTSIAAIASNSTVAKRDRKTGLAHFFVFWGFITLFIGTVILTIDEDILAPISNLVVGHPIHFFHGPFYLVYSVILDVMGLGAIVGLAYLIGRRFTHPPQLDYTRAEKPEEGYSRSALRKGDALFAWFLMAVLVTGFLQEGFRIDATGVPVVRGVVAGRLGAGQGVLAAWGSARRRPRTCASARGGCTPPWPWGS